MFELSARCCRAGLPRYLALLISFSAIRDKERVSKDETGRYDSGCASNPRHRSVQRATRVVRRSREKERKRYSLRRIRKIRYRCEYRMRAALSRSIENREITTRVFRSRDKLVPLYRLSYTFSVIFHLLFRRKVESACAISEEIGNKYWWQ